MSCNIQPAQTAWTVFRLSRFNIWFEDVKIFWILNDTWQKFPLFLGLESILFPSHNKQTLYFLFQMLIFF